jgi:hypothetical protein
MTPAIADAQAREYLEAVRERLGDLDPEEREHLLSDTEASLLEAAEAEVALPPEVRLGPPEQFARELRAAAGLPELPAGEDRPGLLARLAAYRSVRLARDLIGELAPVWWVARGFVAVTFLAQLFGDDWSTRYPVMTRVLGEPLGWVLLAGAIAGSVALGRRKRAASARWAVIANVALALAAVWVAGTMADRAGEAVSPEFVYVSAEGEPGLAWNGRPIGNVYPYDRDGRLLQDVRLYDEIGTPLNIRPGEGRPRRVVADRSGDRLFNTFPIRYFAENTREVRRPEAGALSQRPRRIITPPVQK